MSKYNVKLIEKYEAAQATPAYRFAKPEGFEYQAGQHVVVHLDFVTDKPEERIRNMTLASSPSEDYLELVMRQSDSKFKQHLTNLNIGKTVTMFGPTGTFVLPKDATTSIVMIAGGIGITPFRSMLRYILDKGLPYQVVLLYSNPTIDDVAFEKELDGVQADNANSIQVVYSLTKEAVVGWNGKRGRINSQMIKNQVADVTQPVYMVCGSENMVHYIKSILLNMGVVEDQIMIEEFIGYEEE